MTIDDDNNSRLPGAESKSRTERLAERLLEDRAKQARRPAANIGGCFLCGRSYSLQPLTGDESTRFCSDKCRKAYDDGSVPERDVNPFAPGPWHVIAGPPAGHIPQAPLRLGRHGTWINCRHCRREFESKGLRCCSTECERELKRRAETTAVLAEVGDTAPEKRKCALPQCGRDIPNWMGEGTARRRTPKSRRYCSDSCSAKARRMGGFEAIPGDKRGSEATEPSQPIFGASTPR